MTPGVDVLLDQTHQHLNLGQDRPLGFKLNVTSLCNIFLNSTREAIRHLARAGPGWSIFPAMRPVREERREEGGEGGLNFVVATLNYDLLVEQALHSSVSPHRGAPRCYYGGFQYVQSVRKMTDVTKKKSELVQLGNEIVLSKLHGSVNWAWERHALTLKIHDDVRAVFRHNEEVGTPAIIPPIPEKEMPAEFSQIWNQARQSLSQCSRWLICGYSLPPYDLALRAFYEGILSKRNQALILPLSPESPELVNRLREICPKSTTVLPLPGLPEALDCVWE